MLDKLEVDPLSLIGCEAGKGDYNLSFVQRLSSSRR